MKSLLPAVFLILGCSFFHVETPPLLEEDAQHAIELGLRAIKMTKRDLAFQKSNIQSELILAKSRLFLQEPLRVPGYAHSVFSDCAHATSLRNLAGFAFRQLEIESPRIDFKHPVVAVDPVFLARLPAPVAFGKASMAPLAAAYGRASDRARPHLLEALARLGDERALGWAREFYKNDNALVRDAILGSLKTQLTERMHNSPGVENRTPCLCVRQAVNWRVFDVTEFDSESGDMIQ